MESKRNFYPSLTKVKQTKMSQNSGILAELPYYDQYRLNRIELLYCIGLWSIIVFLVTYSFYQSLLLSILFLPLVIWAPRIEKQRLLLKRKERMKLQFKDLLLSLVSSLAVGRSLENSFQVAVYDLQLLYPNMKTEIMLELEVIHHRLTNGEVIERCLADLSERVNIIEITQFVEALHTCKRSGGDLLIVMRRTANMISDQITINSDIQVIIAQKKLESRLMMAAPFAFMQFMNMASGEYMEGLYQGIGYVLITVVLIFIAVCVWFMHRLTIIRM